MSNTVELHVYDLSQGMARQLSLALLGKQIDAIYHTAVAVYGTAYYYGGGICSDPLTMPSPYGKPIQVVQMGTTEIPKPLFLEFLQSISSKFTAQSYNLISNNCNNFSDTVCQFLVGKPIPSHITGLPQEVLSTPMGAMLRPMMENIQNHVRDSSIGHELFNQQSSTPMQPTHTSQNIHSASANPVDAAGLDAHEPFLLTGGNLENIEARATTIAKEHIKHESDRVEIIEAVQKLCAAVKLPASQVDLQLTREVVLIHRAVAELLPVGQAFPFLDILRLITSRAKLAKFYVNDKGARVAALITRFASGSETDKAAHIMTLRLVANILAAAESREALFSAQNTNSAVIAESIADAIGAGFASPHKGVRAASAALFYNLTFCCDRLTADTMTQSLCVVREKLLTPADPNDPDEANTVSWCVLGLAKLVSFSPANRQLVADLDFTAENVTALASSSSIASNAQAVAAAKWLATKM